MSKYIETTIAAAEYQRCRTIIIQNPYQASPTVSFDEESIFKKSDGTIIKEPKGGINKIIDDYSYQVPVYNPLTQQKTGQSAPISQIYTLIWSVYMHEATKRDAALAKALVKQSYVTVCATKLEAFRVVTTALGTDFFTQDTADFLAAQALADTKETPEEKAAVMADYDTARNVKLLQKNTEVQTATEAYNDDKVASDAQNELDAQAAYDAIMNA
jgi:hypothetical protein